MKEKHRYIIAFILLIGLAFNFAHSELGFMTPEGDIDHETHDFCHLIDAATAKNQNIDNSFVQRDAQPHFTLICTLPEVPQIHNSLKQVTNISQNSYWNCDTPVFVINRTLLI